MERTYIRCASKYFDARQGPKIDPQMTLSWVRVDHQVTKGVRRGCSL